MKFDNQLDTKYAFLISSSDLFYQLIQIALRI